MINKWGLPIKILEGMQGELKQAEKRGYQKGYKRAILTMKKKYEVHKTTPQQKD